MELLYSTSLNSPLHLHTGLVVVSPYCPLFYWAVLTGYKCLTTSLAQLAGQSIERLVVGKLGLPHHVLQMDALWFHPHYCR